MLFKDITQDFHVANESILMELCAQLSGFARANASDQEISKVRTLLRAIQIHYPEPDLLPNSHEIHANSTTLKAVAIDDAVLLTLQRTAVAFAQQTSQIALHEELFSLLNRVVLQNQRIIGATKERQMALLQCCSMYLPAPDASANETIRVVPEELRMQVLHCIHTTLQSDALNDATWKRAHTNFFAYLIACLLRLLRIENSRQIVINSLDTLDSLMDFLRLTPLLSDFLPGTCLELLHFAQAHRHGAKATACAIDCLSKLASLVLNDQVNNLMTLQEGTTTNPHKIIDDLQRLRLDATAPFADMNEEANSTIQQQLVNTREKVDLVLSQLFEAMATIDRVSTSSWRVHASLAELCVTVITKCRRTLKDSFVRCIEQLLVLSLDPIDQVSRRCQQALAELDHEISSQEWMQLMPRLEDRFLMHLTELAMNLSTKRASWMIHLLKMLLGYLRVLRVRLQVFVDFSIRDIYLTLCNIVSFEEVDVHVLEHRRLVRKTIKPDSIQPPACAIDNDQHESQMVVAQYRQCLVHFQDDDALELMMQLLHELGRVFSPAVYVDCAMELLHDKQKQRLHGEVLFVLKELLMSEVEFATTSPSQSQVENPMDVHVVGRLIEELLELDGWQHQRQHHLQQQQQQQQLPPTKTRSGQNAVVGASHKTNNWRVVMCLMLDCIGACAQLLGHEFDQFLLSTLYPVTEKLGAQDVAVEQSALVALQTICFFCEYPSVEALFERNMDYFVDALCRRLFHLEMYPSTPFVIEALLRHASVQALPLIDEVGSSLLQSIDLHGRTNHVGPLLRAMQHLITGINATNALRLRLTKDGQHDVDDKPKTDDDHATEESLPMQQLLKDLRMLSEKEDEPPEMNRRFEHLDNEHGDEDKDEDEEDYNVQDAISSNAQNALPVESHDPKREVFEHLVVDTLNRCRTFLAFEDPKACCEVLELIREGFVMLSRVDGADPTKEHNVLRPAVHRLWPSLVNRFKRSQHRVIWHASVKIVLLLSELCGDFVGDCFVDDIWPVWKKLLLEMQTHDNKLTHLTRSMLLLSKNTIGGSIQESTSSVGKVTTVHSKTKDAALLAQVLDCLTSLVHASPALTSLVWDLAQTCKSWLATEAPIVLQDSAVRLFEALAQRNADEVFCVIASLVGWQPPPPPPPPSTSAAFAKSGGLLAFDRSRLGKFYELVVGKSMVDPGRFGANGHKLLGLLHPTIASSCCTEALS